MNYKKIIDISLPLNERTVIYPGNPSLQIETSQSEATGSVLSQINIGSHTGTHIDAPQHAFSNREGIDAIPLSCLIGQARVIDCTKSNPGISRQDLEKAKIEAGERVLLKTANSERGLDVFYPDFVFLSSDAATFLAEKNVALVGIDSWSIKQKGAKDNTPHTALLEKGIPILEGLNLKEVDEGKYFLIALPLRFIGIDGSPARIVLLN